MADGPRAARALRPFVIMICLGLLIVILVPWVTLVLPLTLKLI